MSIKMLLIITLLLAVFSNIMAHPPSSMLYSYNAERNMLTLTIRHSVRNPENHYVEKVTVTKDDEEIIVHRFERQENSREMMLVYRLPGFEEGTSLTVTAFCSRVGSIEEKIILE